MEEERDEIFKAIKDSIVHMAFHEKGNYVLILTLNSMQADRFNFIIEKLMPHFYKLALDQYGICIVNKMIQLASTKEHVTKIVDILTSNITEVI